MRDEGDDVPTVSVSKRRKWRTEASFGAALANMARELAFGSTAQSRGYGYSRRKAIHSARLNMGRQAGIVLG